jgi:alkylation response protein AidB-like acyl-CoA dehydrogenase
MVQLHGGYGSMLEYPVARAFVDYRVNRIYGGTSEVQRELIARKL